MIGLFVLFIAIAAFLGLIALSVRYGVDSRPGSGDPRRSEYPVSIS
ncbi:MAG: hypothetical protein ABI562_01380 [Chloroflexota bacterium]